MSSVPRGFGEGGVPGRGELSEQSLEQGRKGQALGHGGRARRTGTAVHLVVTSRFQLSESDTPLGLETKKPCRPYCSLAVYLGEPFISLGLRLLVHERGALGCGEQPKSHPRRKLCGRCVCCLWELGCQALLCPKGLWHLFGWPPGSLRSHPWGLGLSVLSQGEVLTSARPL